MGLFGSKKTYVSSVVYNMSGAEEERINYLKTVVVGSVLSTTKFTMSECISNNYLGGPGIRARSFHRWARNPSHYGAIGIPEASVYSPSYDKATIAANIPPVSGATHSFKYVNYGPGEISYFAEQWVMDNYQARMGETWHSSYDAVTNEITIHWVTPARPDSVFTPTINFGSNYYYTVYERRVSGTFVGSFMWIYEVGSGNAAMDAMPVHNPDLGEFLPFIPIRLSNKFISDSYKPTVYPLVKKAYKKLTGKKFDDIVDSIADNDDLDDIDRAYVVNAVALNHPDRACRRYLFQFFDFLRTAQVAEQAAATTTYYSDFSTYKTSNISYQTTRQFYLNSPVEEGGGGGTGGGSGDPGNTAPSPAIPTEPMTEINIKSTGAFDAKLDMRMRWNKIEKTSGTGIKAGAPGGTKKGDVWWDDTIFIDQSGSSISFINAILSQADGADKVKINWQKTDNYWESIEITGLRHKNVVKNGESVDYLAGVALAENDGESGFLVPIHYETMKAMSLVDSTQMMTCSTYVVFNCYEVVKQKWYQTGIFKIFVFVVMIAITVVTGGAGAIGLLGANMAVGVSLGFVGLMATIVGAIANALASMILMTVLSFVGTAVFGAKIGAIIATVASMVAMSVGGGLMAGNSMASMWGNMMSVTNILNMTSAVGQGVNGFMQAGFQDIQAKTAELMQTYESESKRIEAMYLKEFGRGDFHFDPNWLTNTNFAGVQEIPQSFLDRTLLTGGDIAEMSLDMLTNFCDATLDLNTMGS